LSVASMSENGCSSEVMLVGLPATLRPKSATAGLPGATSPDDPLAC
jgi:hypothetical protein